MYSQWQYANVPSSQRHWHVADIGSTPTITPMNFENQTALITGSSGGIGEDFAVAFAKRKANLVLVA